MAAQPAGTAARPPQSPQSCEHTSLSTFFPACPTLAPADTHPTMEQNPSPNPNPTSNPTSPPDPQHHPSDPQHQKTGGGVLGGRRKQAKPQRKTGETRSAAEKKARIRPSCSGSFVSAAGVGLLAWPSLETGEKVS